MRCAALLAAILLTVAAPAARASGHGPLFGGATPTLGKGGWQVDQAWMGRLGQGLQDDEQMLRTMLSVGITEDVQISASLPVTLESGFFMQRGRAMAMMASTQDLEGTVAWRFQRRNVGPGARQESTLYVGGTAPLQHYRKDGMLATPSVVVSGATGYASRTHYIWVGGGVQQFSERQGDQTGTTVFYSAVYGYRPPALRLDYPKPDLRFFVEAVGEHSQNALHHGFEYIGSGGSSILVGPTALLLYKSYGLEGGILFPVYQTSDSHVQERCRIAVNFSYFFWRK